MNYRAQIDGLRAIAVLLVIFYHAGVSGLPSGFIGVDIFFVISGYLVAVLIVSALKEDRFSFSSFFTRRLWRLQPAIILLLAVSLVIAGLFYLPDDFIAYLKSAKYTSLLLSNQYFERATTAYAAPDTAQLLLLHTWSLAIYWQRYAILPCLLWLLYRYCPLRLHLGVLAVLTLMSAVAAMVLSGEYPDKSYYFLSARMFEFLIGVIAAALTERALHLRSWLRTGMSLVSLGTLTYVATRDDLLSGFPDGHALAVCLATGWLLMSEADNTSLCSRLLSLKPLVFIGSISYSLYLWHWPIFATAHYLGFESTALTTASMLALTFAVSWAAYIGVERRYRKRKASFTATLLLLLVSPAIILSGLYTLVQKGDGYPSRFGGELTSVISTLKSSEASYREFCLGDRSVGDDAKCVIGTLGADSKSLLMGDSFSNQYWGFFDVLGKAANTEFSVHGTSSCLTLPGIYLFDWWSFKGRVYSECFDNTQKYYDLIKNHRYKYVVLGQVWGNYEGDHVVSQPSDPRSAELSHSRIEAAFNDALQIIIQTGARPVVIKATARVPVDLVSCFDQHFKFRRAFGEHECQPGPESIQSGWFDELFERLHVRYP